MPTTRKGSGAGSFVVLGIGDGAPAAARAAPTSRVLVSPQEGLEPPVFMPDRGSKAYAMLDPGPRRGPRPPSATLRDIERLSAATLKAARAMAGEGAEALDGLDALLEQARAAHDTLSEARILLRRAEAHATVANGDRDQARSDRGLHEDPPRDRNRALSRGGRAPCQIASRPPLLIAG